MANNKKGESVEGENGSCKKKMWKKASLKANKRDIFADVCDASIFDVLFNKKKYSRMVC